MLSGWHCCGPAPAAILGNTSSLSQHVEKLSWATCSFHILQSITSYCSNKAISAYVCSVVQFLSVLEVSSFVKYEQDLPISFAYLFAQLLSLQSSIASNFCLCLLSCLVCNRALWANARIKPNKIRAKSPDFFCLFVCLIAQFSITLELYRLCKIWAISNTSCTCRSWRSFQSSSRCRGGNTYFVGTLKIMQYHLLWQCKNLAHWMSGHAVLHLILKIQNSKFIHIPPHINLCRWVITDLYICHVCTRLLNEEQTKVHAC